MGHDRTAAPHDSDEHRRVPRHEAKKSVDHLLVGETHFPIVINYRSSLTFFSWIEDYHAVNKRKNPIAPTVLNKLEKLLEQASFIII